MAARLGKTGVVDARPELCWKPLDRIGQHRIGLVEPAQLALDHRHSGVAGRLIGKLLSDASPPPQRLGPVAALPGRDIPPSCARAPLPVRTQARALPQQGPATRRIAAARYRAPLPVLRAQPLAARSRPWQPSRRKVAAVWRRHPAAAPRSAPRLHAGRTRRLGTDCENASSPYWNLLFRSRIQHARARCGRGLGFNNCRIVRLEMNAPHPSKYLSRNRWPAALTASRLRDKFDFDRVSQCEIEQGAHVVLSKIIHDEIILGDTTPDAGQQK